MWKSVIYKEWIKTRWFVLVYLLIGIIAVCNIFLRVQHDFTFNDAQKYWYLQMFQGLQYFGYGFFKYVPLIGALAVAVAQYFPETVEKRIKLTFHLPVKEDKVLLVMMVYGACCLLIISLVTFLLFVLFSMHYFPVEVVKGAIVTIAPWFLSGFVAYFLTALIVLEPMWKYRFLYLIVASAFIPLFLTKANTGANAPSLPILAVFTVILSISLLFSGYRFRKGEM